jgi:hypothetical protein
LGIFVRNVSEESPQAQLITMRGQWIHVSRGDFHYTIPGFLDPKVVEPILPYLPTEEVAKELLDQSMVLDVSVPRTISAPIVSALKDFANKTDEVYRQHAARLDDAHQILSHPTDLRFGSIEKIAHKLLGVRDHPEHALYAVRRALMRANVGFGTDKKSHRSTGMFQIRSQQQVHLIGTVQQWLRNYQDWKVNTASQQSPSAPIASEEELSGVDVVRSFIAKCQKCITMSREDREPNRWGNLGPTKARFALTTPQGALRSELRMEFTDQEQLIIKFLEYWCLQNLFAFNEALSALAPLVVRDTGLYDDYNVDRPIAFMFLMEIGVLEPFINRVLFDVNLLLPSSQHSKPLEQLASSLAILKRRDAHLYDSMADLRHDFKELPVFCIDSIDAKEIDDGISVERIEGSSSEFWVHVHIANPTAFVKRDSVFAQMAAHLTESFYSPERVFPMLPEWMSRDMFSLARDRPTLTFSAKLNRNADVLDYKIQPGLVRNVIKLAYSDLPIILGEPAKVDLDSRMVVGGVSPQKAHREVPKLSQDLVEDIKLIQSLSLARYKFRRAQGGLYYQPTNVDVNVFSKEAHSGLPHIYPRRKYAAFTHGDPVIEIHSEPYKNWFDASGRSNSDHVVREMMMLAGNVAGRFAADRDVPIIYRGMQRNPYLSRTAKDYEREVVQPAVEKYGVIPIHIGQQLVIRYGHSIINTEPVKHPLMGLDSYTKITSPLRRYGDMITHWQIESALREEARVNGVKHDFNKANLAFSRPQVASMIRTLQPRERLIVRAKQSCKLHWISQFFFRAYTFNEVDMPRRFNIVIDKHQPNQLSNAMGRYTYGTCVDNGVRVSVMPVSKETFWTTVRVGDIWEVEIAEIMPYLNNIDVNPLRLVKREMEE